MQAQLRHSLLIAALFCVIGSSATSGAPYAERAGTAVAPGQTRGADTARSTVYDAARNVTWLADANLPAQLTYGLPINAAGTMSFQTAVNWVAALNQHNYLGHNDWMLPTAPTYPARDSTCSAFNAHGGGSFGYGCVGSDLGGVYSQVLRLHHPETAVHIANSRYGPFFNVQPYLYWTDQQAPNPSQGFITFSFETGWQGTNVAKHDLYVLPMITGNVTGRQPSGSVAVSVDGKLIYDANADVTWSADANAAASNSYGVHGVNRDGSMGHEAARAWIAQANAHAFAGKTGWVLPPSNTCGGFHCVANPFGKLFYLALGRQPGQSIATTPSETVAGFHNLQPYLYWACPPAGPGGACSASPAPNMAWSFSFGNGFQGTDLMTNNLFVMVYYRNSATPPHHPFPQPPHPTPHPCPQGVRCPRPT